MTPIHHPLRSAIAAVSLATAFLLAPPVQSEPVSTRHQHAEVRSGRAATVGRLPAEQVLQLDLALPIRDSAGLQRFVAQAYQPGTSAYRHFLTPQEFTRRFGPSPQDYAAVVDFAHRHGLTVTGGSIDRRIVQVAAPVAAIEAAFGLTLRTYQHPTESRTFYAPDREPTTDLLFPLWHVSGLDNYSQPKPRVAVRPASGAGGATATPVTTTGSGPSASFLGSDMRGAYATATTLTGAGQTLGLLEYYGTNLADLNTYYATAYGAGTVPPLTPILVSTDGTSTACLPTAKPACDDTEQTLDMTQALGMAPGLSQLVVFVGTTDTAIISAMTAPSKVAGQPAYNLPLTIACSWGWTPADPAALDPYFLQMAAQGQTFFAASGDTATWAASAALNPWPADDPYVLSVGGTDLVTASAGGAWSAETAWVNSGGGISPNAVAIPAWQQLPGVISASNKGSTTLRNGPDVAANANYSFYTCANGKACQANAYGGTSFAAPMWAAYIALVNQSLTTAAGAAVPVGIGYLNALLYNGNLVGSTFSTDFHDITSGTSGSYAATTGYDLVTGWGSPTPSLIGTLAAAAATPSFALLTSSAPAVPTSGGSATVTVTSTVYGGFTSPITFSAGTVPAGVTVTFAGGINGAGSTTFTVTVAAGTPLGTYPITITGTSGSLTATTTVNLTVTPPPSFTLSASAGSLAVVAGSFGTVSVTDTVSGGFATPISLSAAGQPAGVTVAFGTNPLPVSGTSKLTVTVPATATAGASTVTVTGAAGGLSKTTAFTLNITVPSTFTTAVAPAALSIARTSPAAATGLMVVTDTATGGFNSRVTLTVTGLPTGVTAAFTPTSITGSGASSLKFTVKSTTAAGTYPLVVTGTSGGTTRSVTVNLTIT